MDTRGLASCALKLLREGNSAEVSVRLTLRNEARHVLRGSGLIQLSTRSYGIFPFSANRPPESHKSRESLGNPKALLVKFIGLF
jgi:hypothetical protein